MLPEPPHQEETKLSRYSQQLRKRRDEREGVAVEQPYGRPRQEAPYGWGLALAFWGLKESTIGPKEMGNAADFYTQTKTIYLDHS